MARALDLHSRGQGFDSLILHSKGRKEVYRKKKIGNWFKEKRFYQEDGETDKSIGMIYFHAEVYKYLIYFEVH